MKISTLLFTCSLAAAAGSAIDTRAAANKQFSISQQRNSNFKGVDAPAAYINLHLKYGAVLPPALQKIILNNPILNSKFSGLGLNGTDGATGTAVSKPTEGYDSEYVLPVQIGTPPQTLPLNLDTGSADLWVFSTDTYPPDVMGQKLYDPSASTSTKRLEGESWKVKYGDGSDADGIVYSDIVSIGDVSADEQAVQVAVAVSKTISKDNFSAGIIGLASSIANTVRPTQQKTFIDNVMASLKEPVFTANLQKGEPGNYNFGYINESEYIGDIKYTPINKKSPFWQVTFDGYQYNQTGDFQKKPWTAIVDTGTSLLLLPESMVSEYYGAIEGAYFEPQVGMMLFPCKTKLPDFIFALGDFRGVVPGHYINYADASPDLCYGGIQSGNGVPFAVVGDILIKSQFVVFNRGNLTVGFANKKTIPDNSTSSSSAM